MLQSLPKKSFSKYYFVLQSLHKVCPSNTWKRAALPSHSSCYRLAQRISLCKIVLLSFHTVFPQLLRAKKIGERSFQARVRAAKFAQSGPSTTWSTAKLRRSGCQYNFVLHSLQKVLTSTSSCYFCHKARTNYFLAPLLYKACTNNSSITSYKTSCMM